MPKDYKHISKKNSRNQGVLQGVLPFLTGLTIGLFVAFIVYLNEHFNAIETETPEIIIADTNVEKKVDEMEDKLPEETVEPKFDFYTILPKTEVSVSEWVASEETEPEPIPDEDGLYILQVGSFEDYNAADQVKAKLAFMGITADIQRVVINGRDVRHRVRIGPYKDINELKLARDQLIENKFDFMLLKLEVDNT